MKRIGLTRLIEKLTDSAMSESACHNRRSCKRFIPNHKSEMPGYRIKQLSEEERAVLKTATAKDFNWRGFK